MSSRTDKSPLDPPRKTVTVGRFDKAFPVFLEGEVRYQCFINFARPDSSRGGMRGIGLKFVVPQQPKGRGGPVH